MNDLNHIVSTFSTEDRHRFTQYLDRKNKRRDTKNIRLFKLLIRNDLSSSEICTTLYGGPKKNAYHALRKRLYQSIIDFIANANLEEEKAVDMKIIKFILAARAFLIHKQYKVAYDILDKAEGLAHEHFLFPLLNEIYHTKIQYAYALPGQDVDLLIAKFEANHKNHVLEDRLNIVYAQIRQSLNRATYHGDILDFQALVKKTLDDHKINVNESMSFKSLYQLMKIISISAFVTNDYLRVEPFLLNTLASLKARKEKSQQPYYHIQVVYMAANTLFRNKKFDSSLTYLKDMLDLMKASHHKYFNTFNLKYHLLLALNHNFSGRQGEAIRTLEPFIIPKHPDMETLLDIYLSLIMFYFQHMDLKKARALFAKFYHTDPWYIAKAGIDWVLKKNLIEILLNIELQHTDLVESRLLSFKRNYYPYLRDVGQQRAITFLNLAEDYFKAPEQVNTAQFRERVKSSFVWIEARQEDIFVMSFYAWLKSKMDKTDLYMTTLKLVKKAGNVNF